VQRQRVYKAFSFRLPFRRYIIYNKQPSPAAAKLAVFFLSSHFPDTQINFSRHAMPCPFISKHTLNSHTQTRTLKHSNPPPSEPSINQSEKESSKRPNPILPKRSHKLLDPHLAPAPLQLTHPVARHRVFLRPARQRHAAEETHHHRRVEARRVVARRARQDAEQVRHLAGERRRCGCCCLGLLGCGGH
jgi:hypothetical protein